MVSVNRSLPLCCWLGLQSCSRSLVDILDVLFASNTSSFSAPEIAVLEGYRVNVGEIIVVVRSLLQQWEVHIDGLQTAAIDYSYRAPTVLSRGRGRPRFNIGRDQLVCLSSLNFTWNSISSWWECHEWPFIADEGSWICSAILTKESAMDSSFQSCRKFSTTIQHLEK